MMLNKSERCLCKVIKLISNISDADLKQLYDYVEETIKLRERRKSAAGKAFPEIQGIMVRCNASKEEIIRLLQKSS
jgi:hypothetical protein